MLSHSEFAAAFRSGLFGGPLPQGLTARAPDEAERRFSVYRNNVAVSLIRALAQRFPVVERLVGPAFFAATARVFIRAHPPRTPVLLEYGDKMPDFLQRFPPVVRLAYLPDVARIEVARGRAYHAADVDPAPPAALARATEADPARLRLRLHPSASLVRSPHPVATIWAENAQRRMPRPIRDRRPESAFVARSRGAVLTESVDPGSAAFLAALLDEASLGRATADAEAAAPAFAAAPLLARLIARGLVVDAREGDSR